VISFRYALASLAHRHTEQLVNATLLAFARASRDKAPHEPAADDVAVMDRIADASMAAYRGLIDEPSFWEWFLLATPVEHIGGLPIASRPVSRSGGRLEFESMRAIPWVFSWTQTRYIVPGWFGVGHALKTELEDPLVLKHLQQRYRDWPFFRIVIDNAQREMARVRLGISARYSALAGSDTSHHDRIAEDYRIAGEAILTISQRKQLGEFNAVIEKSIALRNPYTDVLNLIQIELLRRYRELPVDTDKSADAAANDTRAAIRYLIFLSLNGIAAAMQSTG
jgi:phosphoenolpyruvate carboxylase